MEPTLFTHAKMNRDEILRSDLCGCLYCERIYPPETISFWTDRDANGGHTALCPYCASDTVLGDASGVEITPALLRSVGKNRLSSR